MKFFIAERKALAPVSDKKRQMGPPSFGRLTIELGLYRRANLLEVHADHNVSEWTLTTFQPGFQSFIWCSLFPMGNTHGEA